MAGEGRNLIVGEVGALVVRPNLLPRHIPAGQAHAHARLRPRREADSSHVPATVLRQTHESPLNRGWLDTHDPQLVCCLPSRFSMLAVVSANACHEACVGTCSGPSRRGVILTAAAPRSHATLPRPLPTRFARYPATRVPLATASFTNVPDILSADMPADVPTWLLPAANSCRPGE
jgi:hypothetical protein